METQIVSRASFGQIRRLLIVATTGFLNQNFLGAFYIPWLFQLLPSKLARNLALNLLSISPHYFGTMPPNISRRDFMEAEHMRMLVSRESMIRTKVEPYLNPNMAVLDHGCGPGYLASAVSPYCDHVIAVDISGGVIACAKALNYKPNITYLKESGECLSQVSNSSIDLCYSFAVTQHITDDVCQRILQEFFRILKSRGKVICEFVIDLQEEKPIMSQVNNQTNPVLKQLKDRYVLRVVYRPFAKVEQFIRDSGFEITKVTANKFDVGEENVEATEPYYTFILTKP
jgi:ubiquinone/menaquinone biosynthesis C-methylase UbiE